MRCVCVCVCVCVRVCPWMRVKSESKRVNYTYAAKEVHEVAAELRRSCCWNSKTSYGGSRQRRFADPSIHWTKEGHKLQRTRYTDAIGLRPEKIELLLLEVV